MIQKIIHANICTPDEVLPDHSIEIQQGRIKDIYPTQLSEKPSDAILDARRDWVIPGLIDIHTHGGVGADTMDASHDALNAMSKFLAAHGVTSFLATTVTNSQESINRALLAIEQSQAELEGARLLGAHVEGPYINIAFKGAQNPAYFRPPLKSEYDPWLDNEWVKLITIAPELPGMDEFIRACVERGIELAIGHSSASYEQVIHAADLGVRQATHLFNGMQGLHHREPGTVGGVLTDERIFAQIIADGVHLHPAIVKLVLACKGVNRTILISDAMRATGLSDGKYDLGGQEVTVIDGTARIANGSLAGSTLTLDAAVRNVMQFTGADFPHVLPAATRVPAEAMHFARKNGYIRVGYDADLAIFDAGYQVVATIVGGNLVYTK
ncbi:MAG TPA: N-acetylglucosamine-6-phosphate deacetylase [Anaerolineaceae bacterium]|nr:N-acetylglucosamine-6-phosphate deacetylase [Anaerolineaceae bacterium]